MERIWNSRGWLGLGVAFGLTLTVWLGVSPARAQDETTPPEETVTAPAAPADPASKPKAESSNMLVYIFRASPTFFLIFLGISVFLCYKCVGGFMNLKHSVHMPSTLIQSVEAMLENKQYKEAFETLKANNTLFARAVTKGVEKLQHGMERSMEAMIVTAEEGRMDMEQDLGWVATIGSISPMIGLLGTVLGMVFAFQEIALGGQVRPQVLAENIGLALVTTLEGLIIAIPAITIFAYFNNRISRIIMDIELIAEEFLWKFSKALGPKQ